jgi:hypothetical protein
VDQVLKVLVERFTWLKVMFKIKMLKTAIADKEFPNIRKYLNVLKGIRNILSHFGEMMEMMGKGQEYLMKALVNKEEMKVRFCFFITE